MASRSDAAMARRFIADLLTSMEPYRAAMEKSNAREADMASGFETVA